MKLSTRGRYGLHAMYALACGYGGAPMSINTIAETQGISEAYLEQLISSLKRDGLVAAKRGSSGGYVLSRPPKDITVGDVLRSVEGAMELVGCVSGDDPCSMAGECPSRRIWKKISDGLNEMLDSYTLEDMLNKGGEEI